MRRKAYFQEEVTRIMDRPDEMRDRTFYVHINGM
jgi:hypothetical protein